LQSARLVAAVAELGSLDLTACDLATHPIKHCPHCGAELSFFYLGKLIEFGPTVKIFTNPGEKQTEDYITGRFG